MSIEQIRALRAELKKVADKFDQPFGYQCLMAKLQIAERYMFESEDAFHWKAYGRGTVRYIINDLRHSLYTGNWGDGSQFHDAPLFYGLSLKEIERHCIEGSTDSLPERVLIAYQHYQDHIELVSKDN